MAISMDLRVLAKKLEKSSDSVLAKAAEKGQDKLDRVAAAVAAASTLLEGVADDMDENPELEITERQLDEMAALASAFDESGDPLLKKQASVLDEILLSIASPKNAVAAANKVKEDELKRVREERRRARREEAYEEPVKAHAEMSNQKAQAKAVEQQVKRYIPMEGPLQTRYPPDRPGGHMTRITDHVYQDVLTGIVYDFKAGYKTQRGNEIPGGSVENQTRMLGDYRNQGASLFETRESLVNRYASGGELHHLKKYAMHNEIANVLITARDHAPSFLDYAIDKANEDGLSTQEVADILSTADLADADTLLAPVAPPAQENLGDEFDKFMTFENLEKVLMALKEAGQLDPMMIKDKIDEAKDVLTNEQYESLVSRFVPEFEEVSLQRPDEGSFNLTDFIFEGEDFDEDMPAAVNSAVAATQELAPHLLKEVVALARKTLSDQAVKQVLASDFSTKFSKASFGEKAELDAAKILLPRYKKLGWDSVIAKHLKVMASLGVNKEAVSKIGDYFLGELGPNKSRLQCILSLAGGEEFAWNLYDEESQEQHEPELDPIVEGGGEFPEEEQVPAQPETAPEQVPEGEPGYGTEEPKLNDLFEDGEGVKPDKVPSSNLKTPRDDVHAWASAYNEIVQESKDQEFENQQSKSTWFTDRMHDKGFVSPLEREGDKTWMDIAKQLAKETPNTSYESEGFNWEDYQSKHNLGITSARLQKIEQQIQDTFAEVRADANKAFNEMTFIGKEIPMSVRQLPKPIREAVYDMMASREYSIGVIENLQKIISDYNAKNNAEVPVPNQKDLKQAREALGNNKKMEAKELLKKRVSDLRRWSVNQVLKKNGLPEMWDDVRIMPNSDFKEELEELSTGKSRSDFKMYRSWDNTLADGSVVAAPWQTGAGYVEALTEAWQQFPKKDEDGNTLDAAALEERVRNIGKFMESKGLLDPSTKVFGNRGMHQMLMDAAPPRLDKFGRPKRNPVTKEVMPDLNALMEMGDDMVADYGDMKTLFTHPEEYTKALAEGEKALKNKGEKQLPPPVEFDKIVGSMHEAKSIPDNIKRDIRDNLDMGKKGLVAMLESKYGDESAEGELESYVNSYYRFTRGSGNKIRNTFKGIIGSGLRDIQSQNLSGDELKKALRNLLSKAKKEIYEKYFFQKDRDGNLVEVPDEQKPTIPKGAFEEMFKVIITNQARTNQFKNQWRKFMAAKGMVSPYDRAIGNSSFKQLVSRKKGQFDTDSKAGQVDGTISPDAKFKMETDTGPKASGTTPLQDLSGWKAAQAKALAGIDKALKEEAKSEIAKRKNWKGEKAGEFMKNVNKAMQAEGFAGAYEYGKEPGGRSRPWFQIAKSM